MQRYVSVLFCASKLRLCLGRKGGKEGKEEDNGKLSFCFLKHPDDLKGTTFQWIDETWPGISTTAKSAHSVLSQKERLDASIQK